MSEATRAGITKVHMTDQDGVTLVGTGGGAATIADGADIAEGAKADAAWDGVAASASVVAILKKIATSGASAGLTDTQLRATPVPVSGTFWQATQPVSLAASVAVTGTFWQATQPVSGTVTVSGSVAVTGTFWQATQPISAAALPLPTGASTEATLALLQVAGGTALGALKNQLAGAVAATSAPTYVDGTINPLSQTLAGALRVGGTVTATGPLTDTQLRASAVPVSGAFFQVTQPVSGTFWQATQPVSIAGSVAVTGTFFQATQPVSIAATVTTDPSDRAARLLGVATVSGTQARAAAITANPVLIGGRAASYPTKPTAVAAGQLVEPVTDLEGVLLTRPRTINTFSAICRLALAAASSALAFTFVANTDKQLATIFHAAGSTKTVRIRRVWIEVVSVGAVAGQLQFELRRLTSATTPATGNPAITPVNRNPGGAAVDATILCLPTTAGTDFGANSPIASRIFPVIASEAPSATTWPAGPATIVLYDEASADDEEEAPVMRSGNAEGYAIVGRSTAAVPITFIVRIVFTEE